MTIEFGNGNRSRNKNQSRVLNDFIINEIKLIAFDGAEYDIRNMRLRINIYSDIFSPFLSGTISFLDGLDLPVMYPLVGEEKLKISFTSPYDRDDDPLPPIDKEFRIYKMDHRGLENNKTQIYVLKFISEEFIKQNKTKVFKTFKDMPYSEMVEKIFEEFIKVNSEIEVEETLYDQQYCVSNQSPIEAINTISSRSISKDTNSKAYVFYENLQGFVFSSIGKLIEQEPSIELSFGVIDTRKDSLTKQKITNVSERPVPNDLDTGYEKNLKDFRTVQQYYWTKSFDILENQSYGYYNSKLFTYDPVRQVWDDEIDFDIDQVFGELPHLSKEKPFTDNLDAKGDPLSNIKLRRTNKDHNTIPWLVEREPGILPFNLEEYIQQRTHELKAIEENKIAITTSGNPEIFAGQTLIFNLPEVSSDVSIEKKQEFDRYFSGKWLITSVCQRLEQDQYFMDLEISKDSINQDIEHDDIIDRYKEMMRND
jgi:hypothetical protein